MLYGLANYYKLDIIQLSFRFPLASTHKAPKGGNRLVDQLDVLSEMVETLTYRIIELEERLAAHQLQLKPLADARHHVGFRFSDETVSRLKDTEAKLAQIEAVLIGLDSPSACSHLQVISVRESPVGQSD